MKIPPKKKKCDCIMAALFLFLIFSTIKLLTIKPTDPYIFTFSWMLFTFTFLAIIIFRYNNLQNRC